jgi:hypothetical protein
MNTWFFILAYAVGPLLMAFAVILIQRRLRRTGRGGPPVKDSNETEQKRDGD